MSWLKHSGGDRLCECGHTGGRSGSQHEDVPKIKPDPMSTGLWKCRMCDCQQFKDAGPIPVDQSELPRGTYLDDESVLTPDGLPDGVHRPARLCRCGHTGDTSGESQHSDPSWSHVADDPDGELREGMGSCKVCDCDGFVDARS